MMMFWTQVEGQPFSVITAPAHRASPGQASTEDGSLQVNSLAVYKKACLEQGEILHVPQFPVCC